MHPLARRILSEPLLHFLLIGAGLFALDAARRSHERGEEPRRIVLSQGDVQQIAATFSKLQGRPPTGEELAGLVHERVREEVFAREARRLGLDQDDGIVRRRLSQKMEFLFEDVTALVDPTDADLEAYLSAHPDAFRVEPKITFRQVFLNPEKHGANLASDAEKLLGVLREAGDRADGAELGDTTLLPARMEAVPLHDVAKEFGDEFAIRLGSVQVGAWQGPIESAFGTHLVLVAKRTEGRVPPLAEVRDAVRRDWANQRRSESNERSYQELLRRYVVTIEGIDDALGSVAPASTKSR